MINIIWFRFDLMRFWKDFSVCTTRKNFHYGWSKNMSPYNKKYDFSRVRFRSVYFFMLKYSLALSHALIISESTDFTFISLIQNDRRYFFNLDACVQNSALNWILYKTTSRSNSIQYESIWLRMWQPRSLPRRSF